jgi:hypothetical protein
MASSRANFTFIFTYGLTRKHASSADLQLSKVKNEGTLIFRWLEAKWRVLTADRSCTNVCTAINRWYLKSDCVHECRKRKVMYTKV